MTLTEALREKLERRRGPVFFSDLSAHLARDAVFVVRADLDLVDCGIAVANDDVELVGAWIQAGKLRRPSRNEQSSWPNETTRTWMAIVVQPFVLIQDAPDETSAVTLGSPADAS